MFLALDESFEGDYCTIGCVCLPQDKLPELEKKISDYRIKEKLWGEVKCSKVTTSYLSKYVGFLEQGFAIPGLTFHSWTYKKPNPDEITKYYSGDERAVMYKQAYLLLRSVIRKCVNEGYRGSFYILPDTSERSASEYATTQRLLIGDSNIRPQPTIEFCSDGSSSVCSALQIADVCTGVVQALYVSSATTKKPCLDTLASTLTEINSGVPINNSPARLPALSSHRLHHCLYRRLS